MFDRFTLNDSSCTFPSSEVAEASTDHQKAAFAAVPSSLEITVFADLVVYTALLSPTGKNLSSMVGFMHMCKAYSGFFSIL